MSVQDQDIKVSYLNAFSHGVLKGKLTLEEAAEMYKAKTKKPNRGDPMELKAFLYYEKAADNYLASPWFRTQVQQADQGHSSNQQQNNRQAMVARAMVQEAASNNTMTGQQPQQRSYPSQQYRPGITVSVQPGATVQRSAVDPGIKQAVTKLQQAIDELPGRLAAAVQRSQAREERRRKQAPARVTKAAVQDPPPPTLPISPYTGKPSQISAAVRGEPSAWLPQHIIDQQVNQGQAQKSMVISPLTGQPSELTAQIRRSVGIND